MELHFPTFLSHSLCITIIAYLDKEAGPSISPLWFSLLLLWTCIAHKNKQERNDVLSLQPCHPGIDLLFIYTPRVTNPSSKIILIIDWLTTPLSCSSILLNVENCKPPDLHMHFLAVVRLICLSILQPNNKSQFPALPVPLYPSLSLPTPFPPFPFFLSPLLQSYQRLQGKIFMHVQEYGHTLKSTTQVHNCNLRLYLYSLISPK